jgi:tellurite resistance protein TerC
MAWPAAPEIPTPVSLAVIILVLAVVSVASLRTSRTRDRTVNRAEP